MSLHDDLLLADRAGRDARSALELLVLGLVWILVSAWQAARWLVRVGR